jgi:hypothetical protein
MGRRMGRVAPVSPVQVTDRCGGLPDARPLCMRCLWMGSREMRHTAWARVIVNHRGAFWIGPIAETIPGTKRPLPERPKPVVPEVWADDPRYRTKPMRLLDGSVERFYTTGALAVACGKDVQTIRRWIRDGTLPDSAIRTQEIKGTLGDAGRRLWTREQVIMVSTILFDEGLGAGYVGRHNVGGWVRFKNRVWALWRTSGWL